MQMNIKLLTTNITIVFLCVILLNNLVFAQYNTLWIPDTLTGTTFNLNLHTATKQLVSSGQATNTYAYNTASFWGPTLIMNKDECVQINLTNNLPDTTTTHWHGFHIPAMTDGGPHQPIAPNEVWSPFFKIRNNAATYWYHPHLHTKTTEQVVMGAGGLIIVRDPIEAALPLPRKYGIDDIPVVLTSRRYTTNNQFVTTNSVYGDYMLTNGTPNAQVSLPKQYVRLRILNAEVERAYNLGFSDNRTFYVIGNDGGLLNAPVPVTRMILVTGERVELLVNLGNDPVGTSLDLMAYNAGQPLGFPGGEPNTTGQFGSLLNNTNFSVLHINVAATTSNPITTLPTTLVNNTYWTAADATNTRQINVTGGAPPGTAFTFDNAPYDMEVINQTVNLDAIERWNITNNNVFGHAFHIHDVQFKIVARNNNPASVKNYESGWKDVLYLPRNESVSFVAKFDHFADDMMPYMYHCHFLDHEDGGMMGQFVVTGESICPVSISGTTVTCGGTVVSYTTPPVDSCGVTYTWTVTGGTILNGQGSNQISVQWNNGATGTVTVEQVAP
jgi:bilirubin oxidase